MTFGLPEEVASPLVCVAVGRGRGRERDDEHACMLGSFSPHHVLCLGTSLNIPNTLGQREAPSLGKAPRWPRSSPDILTAQHFGVEVEGHGGFLVAGALWRGLASGLGLYGASPFLPVSQDCSGGPAAVDPLSTQGGTGPAVFSLLPRCCLGLGEVGRALAL